MWAKSHWTLLLVLLACLVSLVVFIVSASTTSWITATAYDVDTRQDICEVNYGLYKGKLLRRLTVSSWDFDLNVECDYSTGSCMYSCQPTSEKRKDEINRIRNKNDTLPCVRIIGKISFPDEEDDGEIIEKSTFKSLSSSSVKSPSDENVIRFIGPGYWVSTNFFLYTGMAATIVLVGLVTLNILKAQQTFLLGTPGLVAMNSVVVVTSILTLALWGSLYIVTLRYNVAVTDTLRTKNPMTSEDTAQLGYSYFILIIPLALSVVNILLLVLRNYLMEQENKPAQITVDYLDTKLEFF